MAKLTVLLTETNLTVNTLNELQMKLHTPLATRHVANVSFYQKTEEFADRTYQRQRVWLTLPVQKQRC